MKNFIKSILCLLIFIQIINAEVLNLTNSTYEETPICTLGIYNQTNGSCESNISCLNGGTPNSDGTCIKDPLSGETNIYELIVNIPADCDIKAYDYQDKLPTETMYFDYEYKITAVQKINNKSIVNLSSTNEYSDAIKKCTYSEYSLASVSGDQHFCEYKITSSMCPTGLTYNAVNNKCEKFLNGTAIKHTNSIIDYTELINDLEATSVIATGNYTDSWWNCNTCGTLPLYKLITLIQKAGGSGQTFTFKRTLYYYDDAGPIPYDVTITGVINDSPNTVQLGINSTFININPGEKAAVAYKEIINVTTEQSVTAGGKPWIYLKASTSCSNWAYVNATKDVPAHYYCADQGNSYTYSCPSGYNLTLDEGGNYFCLKGSIYCPAGYTNNGTNCKKNMSYDFYTYTCPAGYTITNSGYSTYSRTDPNTTVVNNELSSAVNSSTPPTNNCYTSSTITCSNGGFIRDISSTVDACSTNAEIYCIDATLNDLTCITTNYFCQNDYILNSATNKCEKTTSTCPTGYQDAGGEYCNKSEEICPTGSYEFSGGEKPCKIDIPGICPIGYDDLNNGQCRKEVFNKNCNIDAYCLKSEEVCPEGSYPTGEGNCISKKDPSCEIGFIFNPINGKCEAPAFCPDGYLNDGKNGCLRNYTYSLYACPTEFEGPIDPGIDCQASCGSNGCECNSITPPANNCKKPYSLSNNDIEIIKKRELEKRYAVGSVTPKEYGVFKDYNCGENCLFTIKKIEGIDNQLCFYKENGSKECITVNGCGFKGIIENNIYPNNILELNLDNQYTISLGNSNPVPSLSNNVTCPVGQSYNSATKYCEKVTIDACENNFTYNEETNKCVRSNPSVLRTSNVGKALQNGDTWNGLNWGSRNYAPEAPIKGQGGCAASGARNIFIKYINDNKIQVTYTLFSDYVDQGSVTKEVSITTDFIDKFDYGRDSGKLRIDFNTGIVYQGYCRVSPDIWYEAYTLEGFGSKPTKCNPSDVIINGKCVLKSEPTCVEEGFEWNSFSKVCYKSSEFINSKIESTCKMNGHVGWHSREEGIISIIEDKNNVGKILFWDSYKDKDIGFIEFIKDVKSEDKEDGFIPENIFLYDMLGEGFTASDAIDGNTLFSYSNDSLSTEECQNIATQKNMFRSSFTTDAMKELGKKLSGNRFEVTYTNPICVNGVYVESARRCINDVNNVETVCTNGKYDRINANNDTSTLLQEHTIWDNEQGDNIEIYTPFFASYSGIYNIKLGTLGNAQLLIDGTLVSYVESSTLKQTSTSFFLESGLHQIKVIARKDTLIGANGSITYGQRGFAVTISTDSNILISSSENWCKNTENTECPTEGFTLIGNTCIEVGYAHCVSGTYDDSLGQCVTQPRCILSKTEEFTFNEQESAIKREIKSGENIVYKCSPLKCINHQCQTADCPIDSNGIAYQGNIISDINLKKDEDCIDQSCDANKPYYEYCGKENGCDTTNPLIYEDTDGSCKELYCEPGYIMDSSTKRCKKLECPEGTTVQTDGSCKRI